MDKCNNMDKSQDHYATKENVLYDWFYITFSKVEKVKESSWGGGWR